MDTAAIILLLSIFIIVGSSPLSTENTKTDKSLRASGNLLQPYTNVDPKSCHCLPRSSQCKLSIAKSSLRAQEISCPENHQYCCDFYNEKYVASVAQIDENPPETNRSKVVIRILPVIHEKLQDQDPSYRNDSTSDGTKLAKQEIKCNCRAREDCEDAHTDYSFGFHCSYDKVRCCEPLDKIKKEIADHGRLITISANDQKLTEEITDDHQCQCMSSDECQESKLTVIQDQDMLCPFHYIKCCGPSIMKKSDVNIDTEGDATVSQLFQWNGYPSDAGVTGQETREGINIHGQPGFRQPIQLPVLKIPVNDTKGIPGTTFTQGTGQGQAEIVNSPPELPHSYDNVNGQQGNSGGLPMGHQSGPQRPPIYQYYGNVGGSARPNGDTNFYPFNINSPRQQVSRDRSAQSPSFLETVSNFFFG